MVGRQAGEWQSSWAEKSVLAERPDQTAKRLLDPATRTDTAIPDDSVVPPAKLQKLEALATERILAVGGANMDARRAVLAG